MSRCTLTSGQEPLCWSIKKAEIKQTVPGVGVCRHPSSVKTARTSQGKYCLGEPDEYVG